MFYLNNKGRKLNTTKHTTASLENLILDSWLNIKDTNCTVNIAVYMYKRLLQYMDEI